ncbi:amino acid/amide ABC transporter substrate-binding protein, HAAT family (TC 3.A.1.4.-) [Aerococcus urinaehominis]|nr:ABC transporter substrate-binding protein [Aerococcus urinaehominis]SDM63593.1 amino acid/amide ABC transporter substrate-binding protein, HAAT family (TC 3.A.1.4.-) [Aerococcus urinaehominis]
MKKKSLFGLAASAMLLLAACGGGGGNSAGNASGDADTAKFGLVTILSGNAAAYGTSIKEGAELAVEEINQKGDGQVELIVEDDKGDKNETINAVNKLIHSDNVLAIEGPTLSGQMFAAGPIGQEAGVTMLGTSTTAEGITDIGDYIFRNSIPESTAVAEAVRQSHDELGYKTAAVLYSQNNDMMVSVNNTLQDTFNEVGVEVVTTETFADGDTDFSAQLTNIKAKNPDVIAVASLYQEGALIVKKAREMGLNQPIVGSNGFNSPEFIEQAGAAADGSIVGTPWFPDRDSDKVRDFNANYEAKYGKKPDQFAAQSYDAIYLLYQAWLDSGKTQDRAAFRDALANIDTIEGVTGDFKFTEKGDPEMAVQVLKIEDGQFTELSE